MIELKISSSGKHGGQVQIADEVITVIAGTAALEIDGVAGMSGNFKGEIAEALGVRNLSKGVKITVDKSDVSIDINLLIKHGYGIPSVCEEVQKRVKTAIETMTGLNAKEININVTGVYVTKEKPQKEKLQKEKPQKNQND